MAGILEMSRMDNSQKDEFPLKVVNVIGSGDLDREIDLVQVARDANIFRAEIKNSMSALFLQFDEAEGLVILYRTGKYIIRGRKEYDKLYRANEEFLELVKNLGIIQEDENPSLELNNVVFVGDLSQRINLEELVVRIGLETAEFEPEQFPGLVYRPSEYDCVLLVFGSGKVSITGSASEETALKAFQQLEQMVQKS
jgi:transcription initiation factor TFIID TATA-box-binding protein